jgi:hypothetical protein
MGRKRRGEAPSKVCLYSAPATERVTADRPSVAATRDRVPHISLVFREMWDTTVLDAQLCRLSSRLPRRAVGPEESWAGLFKEMKNPTVRQPLPVTLLPFPCHPDRSEAERRDLRFRGSLVETRNTIRKQNLDQAARGCDLEDQVTGFLYRQQNLGCPTSRSFFARCGIPRHSTRNSIGVMRSEAGLSRRAVERSAVSRKPSRVLSGFVSGHDLSRAIKTTNDEGFSPCGNPVLSEGYGLQAVHNCSAMNPALAAEGCNSFEITLFAQTLIPATRTFVTKVN